MFDQPTLHINTIKSFINQNVNLHLQHGTVIVNVKLTGIAKTDRGYVVFYKNHKKIESVCQYEIQEIDAINPYLSMFC